MWKGSTRLEGVQESSSRMEDKGKTWESADYSCGTAGLRDYSGNAGLRDYSGNAGRRDYICGKRIRDLAGSAKADKNKI